MRLFLALFAGGLVLLSKTAAQDPKLIAEATQIMEKANGVSLSPKLPNLQRSVTFRVYDPTSSMREGISPVRSSKESAAVKKSASVTIILSTSTLSPGLRPPARPNWPRRTWKS